MIKACLCLLAGVYALQLISFAQSSDLIVVVLVAFIGLLVPGIGRTLFLIVAGGLLFAWTAVGINEARIKPQYEGDSIVATVRIVDFPERDGSNVTLVAEAMGNPRLPERLRISWFEPPVNLRFGDVWQLELRLRRPRGNSNPGVFDYEAWLFRERIAAIGYVVAGRRNELLRTHELTALQDLRQRVVDRIARVVPGPERAAVLIAVSVGARHLVSRQQWDRYARTGTSHLMAISGLHVGMAAAGGYFCAAVLGIVFGVWMRPSNQHLFATLGAAAAAIAYAVLSGLAVPAQRATLMITIVSVVLLNRRRARPFIVVAAASISIAAASPPATMAPGFKLSFAAVLVLIWFAIRYSGNAKSGRILRVARAAKQMWSMQLMLLFGLVPLTTLIFGRVAFAAPVVNIIAVPVFGIVTVPLTLVGLILHGAAASLGDRALLIAAWSLGMIEMLIEKSGELPVSSAAIAAIEGHAWIYLLMPAAWVIFPPGWPARNIAWVSLASLLLYAPARPPPGCADIDVLDVGQGLAVVVTSQQNVLVFDTGPAFRSGGSTADSIILPFLASRGIDRVDTLVVSHADLDHAGGVAALLAGIDVHDSRVGEVLADTSRQHELCSADEAWRTDGIEFRFLHPQRDAARDGNNSSCVLQVSAGQHRALLSGDIERPAEDNLVRSGGLQTVDVVIVPHHGSRTSSSPAFVRALQPSLAIVSAGYGNRWGFPKADVVTRWQGEGAAVYTTAVAGALRVRLCVEGGVVSMRQNRVLRHRIWHQ
jgi:competence protein ComEC